MGQTFRKPPTGMQKSEFVQYFGRVYEHSPWVAETLWQRGITASHDDVDGLARAMGEIVDQAAKDRQAALLNAHPDLAGKLAMDGALTVESSGEQASAGLDKCSPEEFRRFTELNKAYREKFGFPFIMAVKGSSREDILAAFESRLENSIDAEFRAALAQVHKIALLRLQDL